MADSEGVGGGGDTPSLELVDSRERVLELRFRKNRGTDNFGNLSGVGIGVLPDKPYVL